MFSHYIEIEGKQRKKTNLKKGDHENQKTKRQMHGLDFNSIHAKDKKIIYFKKKKQIT